MLNPLVYHLMEKDSYCSMTSKLCNNYLKINEDLFQKEAELKGCIKGQDKINKAVFEE